MSSNNKYEDVSTVNININSLFNINIVLHNVVSAFSTKCHLNLKKIALQGRHVEFRKESGILFMKLRNPNTTATIWSSGKMVVTGATSVKSAKIASRRFARILQKIGFDVNFSHFRIINMLATTQVPFPIRIDKFSTANKPRASYEPELHPGATYTIKDPKATLKIFTTGSITITAPSVENVVKALELVCPMLVNYQSSRSNFILPNLITSSQSSLDLKKHDKQPQEIANMPESVLDIYEVIRESSSSSIIPSHPTQPIRQREGAQMDLNNMITKSSDSHVPDYISLEKSELKSINGPIYNTGEAYLNDLLSNNCPFTFTDQLVRSDPFDSTYSCSSNFPAEPSFTIQSTTSATFGNHIGFLQSINSLEFFNE